MTNEAFEKWFNDFHIDEIPMYKTIKDFAFAGYMQGVQAAKQQSAGEIAALQDELNDADGCATYQAEKIIGLKADNERLREALERINDGAKGIAMSYIHNQCKEALAKTPAQSLQAHDNEVIERCAKVAMDWDITGIAIADAIRALKENQFSYSANLDIYNSVIFADAPYGTMIMESKIVKWLCRNRAKDYFDEMVKGK